MNEKLVECKNREFLYALYSRIFLLEADPELLKTVAQKDIKEFFPNLYDWEPYQKLSAQELIDQHLNIDFTEISLLHLTPYESFYTREDAMIESGGDNPIYTFYERFNFVVEKDKARVISPDHIAIEMEFMYMLIGAEAKAIENSDYKAAKEYKEMQKEFLEKHLLTFAPIYLINVKNESKTPFYHDAAMTGLEFLLSDYQHLQTT
ncbi:MAG: molecular chaperone TorD family protein [Epsilonproteobacteria bacterium]|nr:molecular chaperone TorD family protein [Campylobacterota bacterium]